MLNIEFRTNHIIYYTHTLKVNSNSFITKTLYKHIRPVSLRFLRRQPIQFSFKNKFRSTICIYVAHPSKHRHQIILICYRCCQYCTVKR